MSRSGFLNKLRRAVARRGEQEDREWEYQLEEPYDLDYDGEEDEEIPARGEIQLDDRPDGYYLWTSSLPDPPSDDERTESRWMNATPSSSSAIFTPASSSREPSANSSQVEVRDEQSELLRQKVIQERHAAHMERRRRAEIEGSLVAVGNDMKNIQDNLGEVAARNTRVVQSVKRAIKHPSKGHAEDAVMEVKSLGERVTDIQATIEYPLQRVRDAVKDGK
ncbi:hypothetical protein FZEAL_6413 [Fusarium zealandicum]|uniref:Uncharacterized protein n=1 Tax=Fusarium zealandicum TaxID=1053134 RepID=A0A8H4XJI2_9HYPO|nr:hypothetical protein FZEAL_6413 [Fusarium zealandicum]